MTWEPDSGWQCTERAGFAHHASPPVVVFSSFTASSVGAAMLYEEAPDCCPGALPAPP
ncbi:MAG: hypothetical protein ACPIOQ_74705 [Promethearchaeia archaeon]